MAEENQKPADQQPPQKSAFPGGDPDPLSPHAIAEKCLDSPGYILFAAILTPKKDSENRNIIEYTYRRYQFALEDGKQAVLMLNHHVKAELEDLIQNQRPPE